LHCTALQGGAQNETARSSAIGEVVEARKMPWPIFFARILFNKKYMLIVDC
jgi:hypothetical protein